MIFVLFLVNLVDSGEKMGFGVTILLSLVVYIDFVQNTIPVWYSLSSASRIIWLFIVSIIGMREKFVFNLITFSSIVYTRVVREPGFFATPPPTLRLRLLKLESTWTPRKNQR